MIASGALREKTNNPGYYQSLLTLYPRDVAFPYAESIELDLNRTFPDLKEFKLEENVTKMKNVLLAFSMRNLTIGYCQGFNYIVAKLLQMTDFDEESTFWLFTQIAENYLPADFYVNFSGVRTDMEIVKKIIKSTLNEIDFNSELCITNLISRCFISLFAQTVNDELLKCIWDAFFIHGNIVLYRAFIWAIYLLYDVKLMHNAPIEQIHEHLVKELLKCSDTATLTYFLMMYNRINDEYIEHFRLKMTNTTEDALFLNEEELIAKSQMCNTNMPFCLCNKDGDAKRFVEFGCLWCNEKMEVIEDYFGSAWEKDRTAKKAESIDEILIERHEHRCEEYLKKKNKNKQEDK